MKILTEWTVCQCPYRAPEISHAYLIGRLTSGKMIRTSRVVKVIGYRMAVTKTGTVYALRGEPQSPKDDSWRPLDWIKICINVREGVERNES